MSRTTGTITLIVAVAGLSAACVSTAAREPSHAVGGADYELVVQSNDVENRLDLIFNSKTARALCFSVEDWPNTLGQSAGGGGRALLHMRGRALPASDTNFGYCVGPTCEIRVEPKHSLKGHVNYSEFGDAAEIRADPAKRLQYQIRPYFCSPRK